MTLHRAAGGLSFVRSCAVRRPLPLQAYLDVHLRARGMPFAVSTYVSGYQFIEFFKTVSERAARYVGVRSQQNTQQALSAIALFFFCLVVVPAVLLLVLSSFTVFFLLLLVVVVVVVQCSC